MKVIFLDIDGVLVHRNFEQSNRWRRYPWHMRLFDQQAILNLKDICYETNAYLVLSSSWRHIECDKASVSKQLAPYNLVITGMTPIDGVEHKVQGCWRGEEIAAYLKAHPEITNYVILDDDSDMLPEQKEHLVLTSWERGLEEKHIQQAIDILNTHRADCKF